MGYLKVDNDLSEKGVAVDMLSDGTLFVKIRASRSKIVEQERTKQQAPYKNILIAGRQLAPGIARLMGQKITANAVVAGIAGTLPDGRSVGWISNGKPTEFVTLPEADMIALFTEYPDFEEDVSGASQTNATFAAPEAVVVDAAGALPPTLTEAVEEAAKN